MADLLEDAEGALDNQFSEFVDRVLADEGDTTASLGPRAAELRALEENALRLKAAARLARPDAASTVRVRGHVLKVWDENHRTSNSLTGWFAKVFLTAPARMAWGAGLALLVVVAVVAQLLPGTGVLVGTANGFSAWIPGLIVVGVIAIALLIWFDRRN